MRLRRGFTLVELLVVVVIIGILATIAIPKFANTRDRAYLTAMKSDLRNLLLAQESYFADQVTYSATTSGLSYHTTSGVTVTVSGATGTGWSATASHIATIKTCGIFVGTASPPISGQREGEPRCN